MLVAELAETMLGEAAVGLVSTVQVPASDPTNSLLSAAMVIDVPATDWSGPALACDTLVNTVIVSDATLGVQLPFEIVQLKP